MKRPTEGDAGAFGALALVVGVTLWLALHGRPFKVAVAGGLTVAAAILVPLYVLASFIRSKTRSPEREEDGRDPESSRAGAGRVDDWVPERTFEKARAAEENGELWRAKEILEGTLASQAYHPDLYERYGQVLLKMGDTMRAGVYLFVSGKRDSAYEEPISVFLTRFRNKDPGELLRVLPSRARTTSRLPPHVLEEMEQWGWKRRDIRKAEAGRWSRSDSEWLEAGAATVVVFIFVALMVFGLHAFLDHLREAWAVS